MKGLSIHLTDTCNNSCIFCVVDSHKEREELVRTKLIFKFLEDNKNKGYEVVNIHGGEPTIAPNFFEVLEKIKECGYLGVSLQTNARALSEEKFAKRCVDLGVNLFVVSVHSNNREIKSQICGAEEDCLDQVIQGIKNVKKLGAKVRTNTVVCKQNYKDLKDIIEFNTKELKVDHINISAIHPTGKAFKNFHDVTPRLTEIIPYVKESVDLVANYGTVVTLEGFPPCILGEHSKYLIQWEDIHYKLLYHSIILQDYDNFMEGKTRQQGKICAGCDRNQKCGGIYNEYIQFYGWEEFEKESQPVVV